MDTDLLKASWKELVAAGDEFPLLFYAVLFDMAPEVADLFPVNMSEQRRKLLATLGRVVQSVATEDAERANEALRVLGRDHRRFGAEAEHYPVVGQALILTMAHLVPNWSPDHEAAWATAYGSVAATMSHAAAEAAEAGVLAWLELEVTDHAGDLDGALLRVDVPTSQPGYDWIMGKRVWLSPLLRGAGWVKGHISDLDMSSPAPRWASLYVALTDDDLDALALDALSPGDLLRLAPTYEEATDHAHV